MCSGSATQRASTNPWLARTDEHTDGPVRAQNRHGPSSADLTHIGSRARALTHRQWHRRSLAIGYAVGHYGRMRLFEVIAFPERAQFAADALHHVAQLI
jgi:hypothetical protein